MVVMGVMMMMLDCVVFFVKAIDTHRTILQKECLSVPDSSPPKQGIGQNASHTRLDDEPRQKEKGKENECMRQTHGARHNTHTHWRTMTGPLLSKRSPFHGPFRSDRLDGALLDRNSSKSCLRFNLLRLSMTLSTELLWLLASFGGDKPHVALRDTRNV